jgi:ligand-binding sensor domain-containing protein
MPNPDWRFENFNSQNHFISREINNLTIDKHGYLWACSRGVQRFDGYRTIDFNSFDQSNGGLKDNLTDIVTDSDGRVWISSAGLCYYDDASGKFIYVQPDPKHKITSIYCFCVQKNYLWFICDYGLARLDTHTLKISLQPLRLFPTH